MLGSFYNMSTLFGLPMPRPKIPGKQGLCQHALSTSSFSPRLQKKKSLTPSAAARFNMHL